jgi:hypothetical protein
MFWFLLILVSIPYGAFAVTGIGALLGLVFYILPLGWWVGIPIGHAITNIILMEEVATGFQSKLA